MGKVCEPSFDQQKNSSAEVIRAIKSVNETLGNMIFNVLDIKYERNNEILTNLVNSIAIDSSIVERNANLFLRFNLVLAILTPVDS